MVFLEKWVFYPPQIPTAKTRFFRHYLSIFGNTFLHIGGWVQDIEKTKFSDIRNSCNFYFVFRKFFYLHRSSFEKNDKKNNPPAILPVTARVKGERIITIFADFDDSLFLPNISKLIWIASECFACFLEDTVIK